MTLSLRYNTSLEAARVVYIDAYGNALTNVLSDVSARRVSVAGIDVGFIQETYSDVEAGSPVALVGSSGFLEIAVRNGSAAKLLGIAVGAPVRII